MAKLYQKLEKLFNFRILSNEEIPSYLKSLSSMGKMDEPKKIGLFILLFERMAILEEMIIEYDSKFEGLTKEIQSLKQQLIEIPMKEEPSKSKATKESKK